MRKLSKILALVLVLMMAFAVLSAFSFSASAATPEKLYLTPNANWKSDNARFAAYFFGNGEKWVSMTYNSSLGVYEVTVPSGYPNVIFCRMNPGTTANNWDNKWNQTADLTVPTTGPNHYTVKEGTWDKGGGTWSTLGSTCVHANLSAAATCTTAQTCLDCGDPVVSALGHTYNSAHLCTRCNEQASFTVAGTGAHLGTEWDTGNTANDMTYADGVYTKVYTNVEAGSYLLKVARDHDWGTAYPGSDKAYTVSAAGSTVTVTLKGTAVTVTVEAPHTHSWSEATCTEPAKCECGETQGEALGHNMVAGEVVAPTFDAQGYTVYACSRCDATENRDFVDVLVAEAQIGDVKYATLQEALNVGGEVVLLTDIGLTTNIGVTIPKGVTVVLDLNGHVLGSNATEATTSAVISNKGTLTIKDSATGGKITTAAVNPDLQSIPGYASNTIKNEGTLVLEGGIIENTTNAGAAYSVDCYQGSTFTMNGGSLVATRCALRMFCNSATLVTTVTINGGEINGGTRAIWVHLPGSDSTKAAAADLTINGGTLDGGSGQSIYVYTYGNNHTETFVTITGGTFLNDVLFGGGSYKETQETVSITGGTFNGYLGRYLANDGWEDITGDEGYHLVDGVIGAHVWTEATCTAPKTCTCGDTEGEALGHTWVDATFEAPKTCSACGATEGEALVAVATADGDPYATLAEALENGSEIVLLTDIALDAPIVVAEDASYTIDLNGYTLSYESTTQGEAMITNKGNLTINDTVGTGVINYNYVGANDASYGKGNYTISNAGTLTVNGGKITIANLRQHAKYPIDNNSTTGDAILVINGGHLYNYNTSAIRMFCNSTTNKNSVTINGGLIEGYSAIWMQNPGTKTVNGDLTITGGEIRTTAAAYVNGTATVKEVSSKMYTTIDGNGGAWSESSFVNLAGGTFNENVNLYYNAPSNVTISDEAVFNGNLLFVCEHDWVDATCTAPKTCSVCGETDGEALGHALVTDAAVEATCTATGLTLGEHCTRCDYKVAQEVVPALGHALVTDAAVEATCTATGLTAGEHCTRCDYKVAQEVVPALGHALVTDVAVEATCTATGLTAGEHCTRCDYKVAQEVVPALGHAWSNCVCTVCETALSALGQTDAFDFTTEDGLNAALASGKLGYTGTFRNNGDSHQFAADSSIQLVVPANTTVTLTGHSTGYGVFDVYVNGVKYDMAGSFVFTTTEETKVVIVPDEEATYSKAYLKGIALAEYVDRTITSDTTITFGSEGNYKDSLVDFSGIQIGDNGGSNSQVKNGSFDLLLKAGTKVVIHGYPGYTSYQLNGGDEITGEYYTYLALEDTVLTVTPVNGNNYFYSIEITLHTGITLVEAVDSTCKVAGHEAYYSCECHGELTEKVARELAAHTEEVLEAVAPTCTSTGLTAGKKCSACGDVLEAQEEVAKLEHTYEAVVTAPTCTEAGYTTYTCACGDTYTGDEVAAPGHTYFYNLCLVCYAANPYFENNFTTVGENKLVCNEWHLVESDGGHGKPYQFTFVTIPEDGLYIFTADATKLGVFIYTTPYDASDVDGWATGGANWNAVTFGQAELKAGTYYLGFIFYNGEGEYDLTITKHTEHSFEEGACIVCGEPDPNWVPPHEHNFVEGKCECGETDPNYVEPVEPQEEPNFFQKILAWIVELFKKLLGMFKKN